MPLFSLYNMTSRMITKEETRVIDASNRTLGRVATEVASVLMGKNSIDYVRHAMPISEVVVKNASRIIATEKKRVQKMYIRHSGHLGGQKKESLKQLLGKKGYAEALRIAIKGMLPKNRLQATALKRLTIEE
jgi:large subunit ribosomal protein L13